MEVDQDVKNVRAVREAIGDDMELMIDSNHAYSLKEALELARYRSGFLKKDRNHSPNLHQKI